MTMLDWIAQGLLMVLVNAAWQIALVGAVLWGVMLVGGVRSPHWRYGLCVAGLAAIMLCPVLTVAGPHLGLQVIAFQWRPSFTAKSQPVAMPAAEARGAKVTEAEASSPPSVHLDRSRDLAGRQPAAASDAAEPEVAWTVVRDQMPRWLVPAYGLGALFMLARLGTGQIRVMRLRATARPVEPSVTELIDRLRARTSVSAQVGVRQSDRIRGPVLLGLLRPVVLIPSSMLGRSGADLEVIILHELAHVQRRDALVNLFERLASAVLFFHPVIWLLSREMRRQREHCCDVWVVTRTGRDYEYARCLTDLAQRLRAVSAPIPSLAMAEIHNELPRRIAAVLDGSARGARALSTAGFTVVFFVAVGLAVLISACGISTEPVRRNDREATAASADVQIAKAVSSQPSAVGQANETAAATKPAAGDDTVKPAKAGPEVGKTKAAPGELAGIVVDEKGNPLEGVLVDIWTWHPGNETRTDKAGRFRLGPFQDRKTIEVRFSKPGYSPDHIARQPLGESDAVFTLDKKTYLEGRVLAPDGKPVPNALIRANQGPVRAEGVDISTVWTESRSDDQGRYRMYIDGDAGLYDVQVQVKGVGVARLPGVEIKEDEANPLDIQLKRGVTFRAKVVDSDTKEPVAGVRLYHWQHPGVEGRSGADGMVEIEGMVPGKFEFQVDAPEYARWWSEECTSSWARLKVDESRGGWQRNFDDLPFDLDFEMEPVTIVVEKAVAIRGKVLDPEGKPVKGATVAPAQTGSGNSITGDTRYSVRTNGKGEFEMRLPASKDCEYNLVVHDGKYEQWRTWANGVAEPIRTKPGQVIEGVVMRLTRPGMVRGKVVDEEGRPVADREVRAHAQDKLENRYYDPTTRTKKDGTFELKFVRPGEHYIQVYPFWLKAEQAPEPSTGIVTVVSGETVEGVELVAGKE